MSALEPTLPSVTAIDAVFERLLIDIVQGGYPQGSRLPAERELAKLLGASRPTLREALRRLGAWNLVEPRRGSGVVVKAYRDWSIEVIPAYLRHGKPQPGQPPISRILTDILVLRRALLVEVLRQCASRIPAGGTGAARGAMQRAWEHRDDPEQHALADLDVMRLLVEAAEFTPGLWVLNRISTVWIDFIDALRMMVRAPVEYVESYTKVFDLIDGGESTAACDVFREFLQHHDEALVGSASASAANTSDGPRSHP
jgi:GntR family transcriptional regulator, transcriptional repressor for pyruvate dehydrogenase complex